MLAQRKVADDLDGIGLESLLSVALRTRRNEILVRQPSRRETWADEAGEHLTAAGLDDLSARLAGLLRLARLPAAAASIIMAPPGPERLVAIAGSLRAGLTPHLVPLNVTSAGLQACIDAAGPALAIGLTRAGDVRPALMLREAAARAMSMRLVCAFGPSPPDGVVPLGHVLKGGIRLDDPPEPAQRELVAIAPDGSATRHAERDLVGGAVEIARALKPRPDMRILSLMMGASLPALASGPYLSMLTGAEYLPLGVFSLSALWAAMADGKAVSIVAPAEVEQALHAAGVLDHETLESLVLLHPPGSPTAIGPAGRRVLDVRPEGGDRLAVTLRR